MYEHNSAAPVEFAIEGFVAVVAEIHAGAIGLDSDPVTVEFIKCVAELVERAGHVGQRQRGEVTKPAGVIPRDRGAGLVDFPGEAACRGIIAKVGTGRGIDSIGVATPQRSISRRWSSTDQWGQPAIPSG